MTLTSILERRRESKKLVDKAQEIRDRAVKEKRKPTAAEEAEFDGIMENVDKIQKQCEIDMRQLDSYNANLAQLEGLRYMESDRSCPEPSLFDPKTGYGIRSFKPKEPWTEGREYNLPDGIQPEELSLSRFVRGLISGDWRGAEAERRAMAEGIGALGGVLVPSPIADRIIQAARVQLRVVQAGAITIDMGRSATLTLAQVLTEPTAYWVPENAVGTFSDMTFQPVKLQAKKLIAMTKVSQELVEDAANLESILTDALGFALAKELDRAALFGSGVDEPLGLLNTDGVSSTDLGSAALTIDHFIDAIYSLIGNNYEQANLSAIFNADAAKALSKLKANTAGTYQESTTPQAYKDLKKYITSQIPTDKSKTNLYFGDFSNLVIGLRTGLTLDISKEAYDKSSGDSAFTQNQIWFRMGQRLDSLVVRPSAFHIDKNAGV